MNANLKDAAVYFVLFVVGGTILLYLLYPIIYGQPAIFLNTFVEVAFLGLVISAARYFWYGGSQRQK